MITTFGVTALSGTYILKIELQSTIRVEIGKLGTYTFHAGFYYYVGSAMATSGSASLARRIMRHCTRTKGKHHQIIVAFENELKKWGLSPAIPVRKKIHWHIDYLLDIPEAEIKEIFIIRATTRLEEKISEFLHQSSLFKASIKGFGSQDSKAYTHLFYSNTNGSDSQLRQICQSLLFQLD